MAKEPPITPVVFVRDLDDGQIVAIFPTAAEKRGSMSCFAHIGQHSTCAPDWVASATVKCPVDDPECIRLQLELENAPSSYTLLPFLSIRHAKAWAEKNPELCA